MHTYFPVQIRRQCIMKPSSLPSYLVLAALSAAVLAACGGGGGGSTSSSTPVSTSPAPTTVGQSTVSGTVTGFGSVIVDGVRIDDSAVAAGRELDDGSVQPVELKLGQHVEVQHDGQLVATQVRVVAEAEGIVSAVDTTSGTLTVAGQAIKVNTDPTLGPVTVFSGYAALTAVQVNDRVEVHGITQTDGSGKTTLQATRIEKSGATADTADHVNGRVANLSADAHTFQLGSLLVDYSAAKLLPAGAQLANGTEVHVAIPLGTVAGGTAGKATVVKVNDHQAEFGAKDSELGGAISALDATAKTLTVNGVKVDASAAHFDQSGKSFADLKLNAYVVIKGSYGSDGALKATTIVLRGSEEATSGQVELHGSITNFVSVASFMVRDVQVDATGVTLDPGSCGTAGLANDLQVEVTGVLSAAGQVKASAISCEKAGDAHAVLSRVGTASKVDATAMTFTLTTEKEPISVQWSDKTVFRNASAATLSGQKLEVQGTSSAGVLHATKIVRE
jgi:hypothetical protein